MRSILAVVAMLAILPTAHAQDKAKGDIGFNGEFRLRDSWMMNRYTDNSATTTPATTRDSGSTNATMSRFKLEMTAKPSDKISATATLLHNAQFGAHTDQMNTPDGSAAGSQDYLTVNQAFVNWMTSDDVTIKAGRMNYQIGDGTLIGYNDWQAVPGAFDGVLGNYEAGFGRFQAFAYKFAELNGVAGKTAFDAERNVYGLNFDLKTMPEVLKGVNVHLLKDNADQVTAVDGKDLLRYGANVNLAFQMIDLKFWYEGMNGKYKPVAAGTSGIVSQTASGNMMQAELGVNFPMFMASRLFVKYHQDTGDKNSTDDKREGYDAFFHERHASAGHMDLFDWGNLTFTQIGWTGKPMDTTAVGVNYWMFSRTSTGANTQNVNYGLNKTFVMIDPDKSKLGDELDLWATHHYNANFATMLRLSYFMPGNAFTSDVASNGMMKQDKKPFEVFVEGRLTF